MTPATMTAFAELDAQNRLGLEGVVPEATGRPAYHPATMLKIYVTATSTKSLRAGGLSGKPDTMSN